MEDRPSAPWYPLKRWWQPSWCFSPDVGLTPSLEKGDPRWTYEDPFQRSFCSGFLHGSVHRPSLKVDTWGVSMDVAHFSPSEISLAVRDGCLEVRGKHEEKPDQHGFISRCFTRKYRLPAEVDAAKIVSWLSVDGILTVEAPVPETSVPAAFLIPIQVEGEGSAEQEVAEKDEVEEESGVAQTQTGCSTAELHEEESQPAEDEDPTGLQEATESQEVQKASDQPDVDPEVREKQLLPSEEKNPASEEQNQVLEEAHLKEEQ